MPPAPHLGVELVISGWAHTPFGKHQATLEDLISIVVRDAIAHAGLEPKDIDEIVLGNFNAGMNALAFPSSLALAGTPRPGPAARDARRDRMCVRVSAATVQVRLGVQISVI